MAQNQRNINAQATRKRDKLPFGMAKELAQSLFKMLFSLLGAAFNCERALLLELI